MTSRFVRNLTLIACGLGAAITAFGQDNDLNEGPDMMNARREWLFRQRARGSDGLTVYPSRHILGSDVYPSRFTARNPGFADS
jgi:hypothetical protein